MPRKKKETTDNTKSTIPAGATAVDLDRLNAELDDFVDTIDAKVVGKKRGRPRKSLDFDLDWLQMATRLAAAGVKETDIAFFLGVEKKDIRRWKDNNELFAHALRDGKSLAKSHLIAQGLRSACGYDYVEKNIKYKHKILEDGTCVRYPEEISEYHKHQPPNPQLLMFMLCNMSRQQGDAKGDAWNAAHKIEVDQNKNIKIQIDGNLATDQINRLAGKILDQERKQIECKVVDEF